jgi:competence protein ComEC
LNQFRRPLVVALLTFLAGLLPSLRFELPLVPTAILFGFLLLAMALGDEKRRPGNSRAVARLPLLALLAAGAITGGLARADAENDCRALLPDDLEIRVSGNLGAAHRTDPSARVPLLPLVGAELETPAGCGGEIRVRMPAAQEALPPGTGLILTGKWRRYATPVVPSRWPRDPRHHGFLLVDSVDIVDESGRRPASLGLRARADSRLAGLFPGHLEMVEALLLGRREYMDPEVRDRFARAGLSHLLAISGMHVGLLAGTFLLLGSALRLTRRRAIQFTLGATWLYLAIIGASASALRAGTMITIALCAQLLQRPSSATTIVAAAAFGLLAFRPLAILDPGFQLSFAGVLGILILRAPLLTIAPDRLHGRTLLRNVVDAFVVGIAAFLATAPIVAHHFGIVAPVSMVAGVPAVPLMSLALVGAAAAMASDPILPPLAAILAAGAALALDALDWLATRAAALPFGHGAVSPLRWWSWSVAVAVAALASRTTPFLRPRIRLTVASGVAIAMLIAWPLFTRGGWDGLEVHFIDVGQGDATAIRTPGDRWLLVDTGPANPEFDAGERRVVPFLRSRGARRIEAIVLTHPDLDHIGGSPAVMRAFPVRLVFEPGHAVGRTPYLALLHALQDGGAEWRAARSGRTLELDGVRVDFLWPDPETVDVARDANQISAVVRVTYGDFALLLTGDLDLEIEELLVRRHGVELRSTVLKLGHHGSVTSTSEALLEAVRPELAVVSAGRRNRYGHPAPSVIARVEARGIAIARTDQEGTVSLRIPAGGLDWMRE